MPSIVRIEDDQLSQSEQQQIAKLLDASFDNAFQGRTYFKQLPKARLLAKDDDRIMGHIAIEYRIMRLGDQTIRVFGLIDLCVASEMQNNNIGSHLVKAVIQSAESANADFIILFADDQRLYRKLGFRSAHNKCTWIAIDNHQTLGVKTEDLSDSLMTYELKDVQWNNSLPLDLLGYVF